MPILFLLLLEQGTEDAIGTYSTWIIWPCTARGFKEQKKKNQFLANGIFIGMDKHPEVAA